MLFNNTVFIKLRRVCLFDWAKLKGWDTLLTNPTTNIKGDTLRTDATTNTHAGFLHFDVMRVHSLYIGGQCIHKTQNAHNLETILHNLAAGPCY